jgi:hypothetical protein
VTGDVKHLGERIANSFARNPLAWLLLALFLLAEYWNYQRGEELETVCEAVPYADLLPYQPKTDLEKAQVICDDRRNPPDLSED